MLKYDVKKALLDLDGIIDYFENEYGSKPLTSLLVGSYRTSIRPALSEMVPIASPTQKRHYKRRYRCKVPGTQVDDPVAYELRKKYQTPIITERLNLIMETLRRQTKGVDLDMLSTLIPSMKLWSLRIHLKYLVAKMLVVWEGELFWAKVVHDRKPDVHVEFPRHMGGSP